ncbi:MAG TPA: hypothetical protein VEZ90_13410 [Blastocatellia bacterium]|nr:hypothetical protein [Blastocatellia bacterium]
MSDNIDIQDEKYEGSPHQQYHRLINDGQDTWLAVRTLGATGTGVFQIDEAWYDLTGENPQKVLQYPILGYFANDEVCNREFGSRTVSEGASVSGFRVRIRFWVRYGGPAAAGKLRQQKLATFAWNPSLNRFVLDSTASELDQEEIDDVFSAGFLSDSKFLVYNLRDLSAMRNRGHLRTNAWVDSMLNQIRARSRSWTN